MAALQLSFDRFFASALSFTRQRLTHSNSRRVVKFVFPFNPPVLKSPVTTLLLDSPRCR